LRRRSDKNIKDAKVKLALHRQRARAHEFRRDRTQAEVDRLGEQGLAHKALDGSGYHFPVENEGDLRNAIEAVNRARAGERWSIRKFLIRRAKELGLMALIPRHWEAAGHLEGTEHPVKGRYPSSGPPRD
jgi:hypothetical protein